jgi:hypothetical protein
MSILNYIFYRKVDIIVDLRNIYTAASKANITVHCYRQDIIYEVKF